MRSYQDKVVVITGGATGLGFGFAKAFGADGARVVVSGPQERALEKAVARLQDLGVDACMKLCDVTRFKQVEELAEFAWHRYGQVDVILNNAGVGLAPKNLLDTDVDAARALFDVNVWGVWHGVSVFGRRFVEQGTPAAIYNVGSENSLFYAAPGAAYVASKHAVLGLSDALRGELPEFIEVSVICPGFTRSDLIPPSIQPLAMDTDRCIATAMQQLREGRFYVVTHASNAAPIEERYEEIKASYEAFAPRYDGDEEFDVWTLLGRIKSTREAQD